MVVVVKLCGFVVVDGVDEFVGECFGGYVFDVFFGKVFSEVVFYCVY